MKDLEEQVSLEVARVVTNSLNWPNPIGTHMLGRDLAVPIDKIVKALLPVILEREAEAWDEGVKAAVDSECYNPPCGSCEACDTILVNPYEVSE